jgi:hypothetical protein
MFRQQVIQKAISAAVQRLDAVAVSRESGLLKLAVRDAKGQIVPTPWFLAESRRLQQFKSKVGKFRPQSVAAASDDSTAANLPVSLLHHLEEANLHYQDVVTKVSQGQLAKFRI